MKKAVKITLILALSLFLTLAVTLPAFAEPISGVETSTMYITWDEFPGAEEYFVEVFLGPEYLPDAGATIKRVPQTGVLPTHYSAQMILGLLHSDVDPHKYPYGTYTIYITARDADGNDISDRTRADTYNCGIESVVLNTYYTVTVSPGDGTGESYTLYIPQLTRIDIPEFEMQLRDCFFTPPEGKVFDRWSAGAAGEKIIVGSDMTVTPVWKDAETPASEEPQNEETPAEEPVQTDAAEVPAPDAEPQTVIQDTNTTSPTTGYEENSFPGAAALIAASVLTSLAVSVAVFVVLNKKYRND